MKKLISNTLNELINKKILDDLLKWKYSKYSIRKYAVDKIVANLEAKLEHFEKHYEDYINNIDFQVCKQQLDVIHKEKEKSLKIRSKRN